MTEYIMNMRVASIGRRNITYGQGLFYPARMLLCGVVYIGALIFCGVKFFLVFGIWVVLVGVLDLRMCHTTRNICTTTLGAD